MKEVFLRSLFKPPTNSNFKINELELEKLIREYIKELERDTIEGKNNSEYVQKGNYDIQCVFPYTYFP